MSLQTQQKITMLGYTTHTQAYRLRGSRKLLATCWTSQLPTTSQCRYHSPT